ncbi:NAD(P)-binding domain-containing protein [Arenibacter sp. F20364]|uniref:NAD(P)-binding domain-containing protein n=1 Tax=Arenibacter sp. F20364 TaxID=2926415 RepID=UPI001FF0FBC7|nr:NAD(P)-binding domain-containing protein [Arenibacter sp. F20364]MCK0192043.1 NAD(P)-binding domain-containing protein [Arenibacter sp. F20364]
MDEVLLEQLLVYGTVFLLCTVIIFLYLRKKIVKSAKTEVKVQVAKEEGLYEPISLYPHIDLGTCIGSGACITACPEKDILGIVDGIATVINTSNCIGHGACFHACPVEAITLRIGTESRGVELPHVNEDYETNIKGMYIAGELGGMGLIKNSVEQGQQAMENIAKNKKPSKENVLDVVIIGAGPAGISATLAAKEHKLSSVTLEQDSLGGTVYTFPRSKIVMTAPMDLPLYGKAKLYNTSKDELLQLWKTVISEHNLNIIENIKVESIVPIDDEVFKIMTNTGDEYLCNQVLLSIGRRGTPRKLGVPGEDSQKVAYRLLEPEQISRKKIIVVGGGDSAIESALLLKDENEVILSYRKDKFSRLKPKNKKKIEQSMSDKSIRVEFNSNLVSIADNTVLMKLEDEDIEIEIENDLVYIFAGGELPTSFLQNAGVEISKRFGHVMKKHK